MKNKHDNDNTFWITYWIIAAVMLGLVGTLSARLAFAGSDAGEYSNRNKFTFALWGGMPYLKPGEADTQTPKIAPAHCRH